MVQIRNVPSEFHRRLKARAAMEGMSMSDYVLREVGKALERPTRQEVLERIRAGVRAGRPSGVGARPVRDLRRRAAEVIRAERDHR